MRVIAGTARRLQLKTLDGMDTRPTTDRIKETLFNRFRQNSMIVISWISFPEAADWD